jgi:hypothetical protein
MRTSLGNDMRPKIYLPVLGVLVLSVALLWKSALPKPEPEGQPDETAAGQSDVVPAKEISAPNITKPAQVAPPSAAPVAAPIMAQKNPPVTVEELDDLAMKDDAESLKKILAALTHSDPDIREAARDAAVQFGDASAAARLRAVAANTADAEEKTELLEAAEFLELPPLEVRSQNNLLPPD